ncbi:MAG TPA: HDOD domain-containing protein [Terriglobales bacterium]
MAQSASSALSPIYTSGSHFVARQPIFTAEEKIFAYELLFRDGVGDYFQFADTDAASRDTLSASLLTGLDFLCGGHRAFINCTRDVLLKDYITLLPPTQTVVEVLETVPADELVIAACMRLKEKGYWIALDDFAPKDPRTALIPLADIIKVDLTLTLPVQAAEMVKQLGSSRMLAEKVETRTEFNIAKKAGFSYFQGYFFCKPETLETHEIPQNRINYLRIWQAISQPELDIHEIEDLIKRETSLCYRLLRYLNSPVFGLGNEICSVRHALALLGEREVRRWVRLVTTLTAGQDKSSELVTNALIRARFCELISTRVGFHGADLFLMGLMSLMSAILEMPVTSIVEHISLDHDIKSVLLEEPSPLQPFYQLMIAQEAGHWDKVAELCGTLRLTEKQCQECHWEAMQWARDVNTTA